MSTPKQLKARFPYMFEGKNIGISIARGWFPLFEQLCHDIDGVLGVNKRSFHWTQCKEKFGSARFYWALQGNTPDIRVNVISEIGVVTSLLVNDHGNDADLSARRQPSVSQHIGALVDAVTNQTQHICIACGAPAAGDRHGGYVLMLCDEHARQRRANKLPHLWFGEDEE